jgi:hypothetical protein
MKQGQVLVGACYLLLWLSLSINTDPLNLRQYSVLCTDCMHDIMHATRKYDGALSVAHVAPECYISHNYCYFVLTLCMAAR